MKNGLRILLFLASMDTTFAQEDTLSDVFPLLVGNTWTYNFKAWISCYRNTGYTDTGSAAFRIDAVVQSKDSARWHFICYRNFLHAPRAYPVSPPPTTIIDTSYFEIVEYMAGHHLLCTQTNEIMDAFAFDRNLWGYQPFYRYQTTDSNGIANWFSGDPTVLILGMTLHKDTGAVVSTLGGYDGCTRSKLYSLQTFISDNPNTIFDAGYKLPTKFALNQNYPNPFNPRTTIRFDIPVGGFVSLKVYDMLGREFATLVNQEMIPGSYARVFDGRGSVSGVYLYKLQAGSFVQTRKLMLLK